MSADQVGGHREPLQDCGQLAKCFALLSLPVRLRILLLLARHERSVNSLCEELKAPQPSVSHHLAILRAGGIVETRRAGKQIFYRICGPGVGGGALTLHATGCRIRLSLGTRPSPDA
jgi:ArsR family transcriptional regulator